MKQPNDTNSPTDTVPPVTDKMDETTTMEFSGAELGLVLNSLSVAIGILQHEDVSFAKLAAAGTALRLGPDRMQQLVDKIKAKLDERFTDPAKGIRTVTDADMPNAIGDLLRRHAAERAMAPQASKEVA